MTATLPADAVTVAPAPPYRLAVWAFLVNEALLFGSILASGLFLRLGGTVPWPRPGEALPLGPVVVATLVLIASSATLNEALAALRRRNPSFSRQWLAWTLAAGSLFLAIQVYEWWDLARAAIALSPGNEAPLLTNPWGAATFLQVFFLATGLHGLHVVVGLALMAWLLVTRTETVEARLESVTLYWHFVDFVWIFILSTLYFL